MEEKYDFKCEVIWKHKEDVSVVKETRILQASGKVDKVWFSVGFWNIRWHFKEQEDALELGKALAKGLEKCDEFDTF